MKEYKYKGYKGISDLKDLSPYGEYGEPAFEGTDYNDPKAIGDEVSRRMSANEEYIKELKDSGRYGEEFEVSVMLQNNPLFDDNSYPENRSMESYRMDFIDLSKIYLNDEQ